VAVGRDVSGRLSDLSICFSSLEARVNRSQAVLFADLERKRTSNSKALLMPGEQLVKSYGQNREIVEDGIGKERSKFSSD